jgi:Luciferase-like monooxygenase
LLGPMRHGSRHSSRPMVWGSEVIHDTSSILVHTSVYSLCSQSGGLDTRGDAMRFFCFHLMPWAHLPEDFAERYDSAWVTCPNTLYDPQLGHPLYNRYLDELELADQLGFEGICVNEHHQNAYGNMPSPNIMAACLARRTRQAKLAILGNVLPLYDHPQRIAEELAMLDVITQGRIISGMVVGTGMEYFSYNINPTYARERFHEAHDLIVKAWTHDGPFAWEGKH